MRQMVGAFEQWAFQGAASWTLTRHDELGQSTMTGPDPFLSDLRRDKLAIQEDLLLDADGNPATSCFG